jgi:hypothetical protein
MRGKLILVLEEVDFMSSETINFAITVSAASPPPPPPPPALTVVDANGNPLVDGSNVTLQPETVGVEDPGQNLFTVSGGVPPYNYAPSGSIPAGDSLSTITNADGSQTVELSGTPTEAGTVNFSIVVSDSASQSMTIGAKAAARKTPTATK